MELGDWKDLDVHLFCPQSSRTLGLDGHECLLQQKVEDWKKLKFPMLAVTGPWRQQENSSQGDNWY